MAGSSCSSLDLVRLVRSFFQRWVSHATPMQSELSYSVPDIYTMSGLTPPRSPHMNAVYATHLGGALFTIVMAMAISYNCLSL